MPEGPLTLDERLQRIERVLCRIARCICQPQGLRTYNLPWALPPAEIKPPDDLFWAVWCFPPQAAFAEIVPKDQQRVYLQFVSLDIAGDGCLTVREGVADCDTPIHTGNSPITYTYDRDSVWTQLKWLYRGNAGCDAHIIRRGGPQVQQSYMTNFRTGQL